MDDERAFLLEVAETLRRREVRTVVARNAYDRTAQRLTELALRANEASRSRRLHLPEPDATQHA